MRGQMLCPRHKALRIGHRNSLTITKLDSRGLLVLIFPDKVMMAGLGILRSEVTEG